MNIAYYLHNEVNRKRLEQTILWFKAHYRLISASQLKEYLYDNIDMHGTCMLSVDDGWKSTYDVIFPVMKKHSIPFTIFVSPEVTKTGNNFWTHTFQYFNEAELKSFLIRKGLFDKEVDVYPVELLFKELTIDTVYDLLNEYQMEHPEIDIPRGFINEKELKEMFESGLVEVGAHTNIHPILSNESEIFAEREIVDSVSKLSEILDYKVHTFAYPNGLENVDFGEREMRIVKNAGVDMAFSVNPGVIGKNTNPLAIPRWGSLARLRFGRLGQYLPSRANQAKIRAEIRKHLL